MAPSFWDTDVLLTALLKSRPDQICAHSLLTSEDLVNDLLTHSILGEAFKTEGVKLWSSYISSHSESLDLLIFGFSGIFARILLILKKKLQIKSWRMLILFLLKASLKLSSLAEGAEPSINSWQVVTSIKISKIYLHDLSRLSVFFDKISTQLTAVQKKSSW